MAEIKTWLFDDLVDFEKMYENRFDWQAEHTVWMFDIETNDWTLLSTKVDPSDLISYAVSASVYSQSIIVLHGWAAPVDDEVMPSQHDERRRVRILVHIENGEVSFATRFIDGQLEMIENPFGGHFISLIEDAIEFTRENHPNLPATFTA